MNEKEVTTTSTKNTGIEEKYKHFNFWRNEIMWRTTNTGIDPFVISEYAPYVSKVRIIRDLREKNVPYTDGRQYIPKNQNARHEYFVSLINECLEDMYKGKKGYVYKIDHLREVLKIRPDVKIRYDECDMCWYCWLPGYVDNAL